MRSRASGEAGRTANDTDNIGGKPDRTPVWQSWDVDYGRPPLATRFIKGQSGNPKGRPKGSTIKKNPINPATRDIILEVANRPIVNGQGQEITAFKAVLLKQLETALKGNPIAQKLAIDLFTRAKAEQEAEMERRDERWSKYKTVMSERLAAGEVLPANLPHPDDVIFENGHFTGIHGGDPVEVAQKRAEAIQMRDLYLLQAELDRRVYRSRTKIALESVEFASFLHVIWLNDALPKRLQLDDNDLISRMTRARRIRKRDLVRELRTGYAKLGMSDGTTFPSVTVKIFSRCMDEVRQRLGLS